MRELSLREYRPVHLECGGESCWFLNCGPGTHSCERIVALRFGVEPYSAPGVMFTMRPRVPITVQVGAGQVSVTLTRIGPHPRAAWFTIDAPTDGFAITRYNQRGHALAG